MQLRKILRKSCSTSQTRRKEPLALKLGFWASGWSTLCAKADARAALDPPQQRPKSCAKPEEQQKSRKEHERNQARTDLLAHPHQFLHDRANLGDEWVPMPCGIDHDGHGLPEPFARSAAAARSMRVCSLTPSRSSGKRSAPTALPNSRISSGKELVSASKAIRKLASAPWELCQ